MKIGSGKTFAWLIFSSTIRCCYNTVQYDMIKAEYKSKCELEYTPYLALKGELWSVFYEDFQEINLTGGLWGVFCEDFQENWLHYNSTAL